MQVSSVVLHWGEDITGGSEHTVDGHAAALEVFTYSHSCLLCNHTLHMSGSAAWLQWAAVQL